MIYKRITRNFVSAIALTVGAALATVAQPVSAQSENTIVKTKIAGFQDGIKFESLPLENAIIRIKGDGSRKLAMIGDPSCSICQMQEKELQHVDNVTIYTFAENILQRDGGPELVRRIWCHADNEARASAWEALVRDGITPDEHANCTVSPYSMLSELGELRNGKGNYYRDTSPTLILGNSITSNGLVRAGTINELLDLKP